MPTRTHRQRCAPTGSTPPFDRRWSSRHRETPPIGRPQEFQNGRPSPERTSRAGISAQEPTKHQRCVGERIAALKRRVPVQDDVGPALLQSARVQPVEIRRVGRVKLKDREWPVDPARFDGGNAVDRERVDGVPREVRAGRGDSCGLERRRAARVVVRKERCQVDQGQRTEAGRRQTEVTLEAARDGNRHQQRQRGIQVRRVVDVRAHGCVSPSQKKQDGADRRNAPMPRASAQPEDQQSQRKRGPRRKGLASRAGGGHRRGVAGRKIERTAHESKHRAMRQRVDQRNGRGEEKGGAENGRESQRAPNVGPRNARKGRDGGARDIDPGSELDGPGDARAATGDRVCGRRPFRGRGNADQRHDREKQQLVIGLDGGYRVRPTKGERAERETKHDAPALPSARLRS